MFSAKTATLAIVSAPLLRLVGARLCRSRCTRADEPLAQRAAGPASPLAGEPLIRDYRPEDDPELLAIERLCVQGTSLAFWLHRTPVWASRALQFGADAVIRVATGEVIGATCARVYEGELRGQRVKLGYVFDTRVKPTARRRGLGCAVMHDIAAQLRQRGCHHAYAEVMQENTASLKMIRRCGWFEAAPRAMMGWHCLFARRPTPLPPGAVLSVLAPAEAAERLRRCYADTALPHDLDALTALPHVKLFAAVDAASGSEACVGAFTGGHTHPVFVAVPLFIRVFSFLFKVLTGRRFVQLGEPGSFGQVFGAWHSGPQGAVLLRRLFVEASNECHAAGKIAVFAMDDRPDLGLQRCAPLLGGLTSQVVLVSPTTTDPEYFRALFHDPRHH